MDKTTHTIDAAGRALGRVATEAAHRLMGKSLQNFARNKVADIKVVITGASGVRIFAKKAQQKTYTSYSGYPGGIKRTPLKKVLAEKGAREAIRRAVYGMLPKNRLRARMIKNLDIRD